MIRGYNVDVGMAEYNYSTEDKRRGQKQFGLLIGKNNKNRTAELCNIYNFEKEWKVFVDKMNYALYDKLVVEESITKTFF